MVFDTTRSTWHSQLLSGCILFSLISDTLSHQGTVSGLLELLNSYMYDFGHRFIYTTLKGKLERLSHLCYLARAYFRSVSMGLTCANRELGDLACQRYHDKIIFIKALNIVL